MTEGRGILRAWVVRSGPVLAAIVGAGAIAVAAFFIDRARSPGPPSAALRVEWPVWGGDPGGLRYSPLETIHPDNVTHLRPAWEWRTGERAMKTAEVGKPATPGKFETTPIMLGDTLYLSTPYNRAIALEANSGRQLWAFDPGAAQVGRLDGDPCCVHRGIAVWTGRREEGRRVLLNSRWRLFALDAGTGRAITSFGQGGAIDLTKDLRWPVDRYQYGNTSPPVIYRDLVIVGSSVADRLIFDRDPPGDVQAFDVRTGKRAWRWESIPRPGEPGSETWEPAALERTGHANVWAPFSVDTARGLLYLPVSAPSNDWYGGRRKGANLFGESLVCLDARTGRLVWFYQLVHHGLWDYDPPAQPVLLTLDHDGRRVDAVALAGKTGFVYVFDRVTGQPLWPIEERPVPASDVPGEQASPTQPFPTRPPPFARQGVADSDLVDFTPELRERARAALRGYRLGTIFTPPSVQGTLIVPGWIGGAGWGGGAFDSTSGTLYVKSSHEPSLFRLIRPDSLGASAGAGFVVETEGLVIPRCRFPPIGACCASGLAMSRFPSCARPMEP